MIVAVAIFWTLATGGKKLFFKVLLFANELIADSRRNAGQECRAKDKDNGRI